MRTPRENIIIQDAAAERAATRWTLGEGGCWISTYSVASHGYAQIGWNENGKRHVVTAHRAAWVHVNGQIPVGMTIDHQCRVRRCVNPDHLQLMSNHDNAKGGGGYHRQKPVPTGGTCRAGHPVLLYPSGAKHCRECAQAWARSKAARQAARRSGGI